MRALTQSIFSVLLASAMLLALGACKDDNQAETLQACLAHVPPQLPVVFSSKDLGAVLKRLEADPGLTQLRATSMWQDLTMDLDLLAPERVAAKIATQAGAPMAEVLAANMLEGRVCGAVNWHRDRWASMGQPGKGYLEWLLVKRLDRSQSAVQKAVDLWLKAGSATKQRKKVGEVEVVAMGGSEPGLAWFTSGDWLVVGGTSEVHSAAQYLAAESKPAQQEEPKGNKKGNKKEKKQEKKSSTIKRASGPRTLKDGQLALHIDVPLLLDDLRPTERPLGLMPWQTITADLSPTNAKEFLTLTMTAREGWLTPPNSQTELHAPHYIPKSARVAITSGTWDMGKWYQAIAQRYGATAGPLAELKVDFAKDLRPLLSGEVMYFYDGPHAKGKPVKGELFFAQVLGFGIKAGVKHSTVEAVLRTMAIKGLRGRYKRRELKEMGNATMACMQRGGAATRHQRCFALHKQMLLVGYQAPVLAALQVASGKAPDLSDARGLPHAVPTKGCAGLALLDLRTLSQDMLDIARHNSGQHVSMNDINTTLAPFITALGKVAGLQLVAGDAAKGGGVTAKLFRL